MGKKWGSLLLLAIFLLAPSFSFAAKKDFKGLFGSYRRDKFTENEGRSTDIGMDILLSTMMPLTTIVSSSENGQDFSAMQTSMFFNGEMSFFLTLDYNFEIFANVGYYTYDTRKQNNQAGSSGGQAIPVFHQFQIDAIPVVGGIKYRMSTEDIVPYIGLGLGYSYVHRRATYDNSQSVTVEDYSNAIVAQITAGVEFFFASRAGLRLEASAMTFRLPALTVNPVPGGNPANFPLMNMGGNPWLIRYASGVFFLF